MAYQTRGRDPLFDSDMQATIERRGREFAGLLLMAAGLFAAASFWSWSPDDPSWIAATDAPVQNWMGRIGAGLAAPVHMVIGLGGWGLALLALAWGMRMALHQGDERALSRIIFAPIWIALLALYAATFLPGEAWSQNFNLGGHFGDTVLGAAIGILPVGEFIGTLTFKLAAGAALLVLGLHVLGFTRFELAQLFRLCAWAVLTAQLRLSQLCSRGIAAGWSGAKTLHAQQKVRAAQRRAEEAEIASLRAAAAAVPAPRRIARPEMMVDEDDIHFHDGYGLDEDEAPARPESLTDRIRGMVRAAAERLPSSDDGREATRLDRLDREEPAPALRPRAAAAATQAVAHAVPRSAAPAATPAPAARPAAQVVRPAAAAPAAHATDAAAATAATPLAAARPATPRLGGALRAEAPAWSEPDYLDDAEPVEDTAPARRGLLGRLPAMIRLGDRSHATAPAGFAEVPEDPLPTDDRIKAKIADVVRSRARSTTRIATPSHQPLTKGRGRGPDPLVLQPRAPRAEPPVTAPEAPAVPAQPVLRAERPGAAAVPPASPAPRSATMRARPQAPSHAVEPPVRAAQPAAPAPQPRPAAPVAQPRAASPAAQPHAAQPRAAVAPAAQPRPAAPQPAAQRTEAHVEPRVEAPAPQPRPAAPAMPPAQPRMAAPAPHHAPQPYADTFDEAEEDYRFDDFGPDSDEMDRDDALPLVEAPSPAARPALERRVVQTAPRKPAAPSTRAREEAQPALKFEEPQVEYELPPLNLLMNPANVERFHLSDEALEENARMLENVLDDYGVKGEIVSVRPGPVVTMYELEPAPGLKASRVIGLADDIARSMSALSARVSTVPGRSVIGIELPNDKREMVALREILSARDFGDSHMKLPLALGKDIGGDPMVANLAKMPHLLIAGTTGSGKSVAINTMILSLLYRLTPEDCRLIMIDPKMLELSVYDGIPHLLSPVVTDPKKAVVALKWVVGEMEERYRKMSKMGVRNIDGYNGRVADALAKGEMFKRTVQTGFDDETGEPVFETEEFAPEKMPYIVVIVDEMADLMMVAGKEIEACIQRLAQMARASGIHLIMATQRPSVDVITGTIKANFPTRISFQVTSKIDSRTILGEMGAEQLLGMGDMLYMAGGAKITRCHGPFVSDEEVEEIVNHLKAFGPPSYVGQVVEGPDDEKADDIDLVLGLGGNTDGEDALYDQAVAVVIKDRKCSTSYIQRKLGIGYNKAARLVEQMEEEGLVTPANHVGKREILVPEQN